MTICSCLLYALLMPGGFVERYQTLLVGIFALIAALITYAGVQNQIAAQKTDREIASLREQLSVIRLFVADLYAVRIACDEFIEKLKKTSSSASSNNTDGTVQILVPLSTQMYKDVFRYIGILGAEIIGEISVFYNALPIYEQKMKQTIPVTALKAVTIVEEFIKLSNELRGRADKLYDALLAKAGHLEKRIADLTR
jgi:hypothetical protein